MRAMKKFALGAVLVLGLLLTGCGSDSGVYVQSVEELAAMGGIAPGDRFAGLVVSENVAEVQKDGEKTISELFIKEGDDVDKQRLEKEQLAASIDNYKSQIEQMEKDRDKVGAADKLQYTIQIQSTQVDLKEAELNLKTKEAEVKKSEDILEHATVVSPVTGRVQAVNENGMDNYGNPLPYISIQQSGAYRIKGTLGELQRGGIMEGSRMKILSRTDETRFWMGTVTLVDYENPVQENNNNYYIMSTDEMTTSSKYPFYVELESTEGLILGQHVYLEVAVEEGQVTGIPVSMAFIGYEDDGTPYVWAEDRGRLEKRHVTLGQINDMLGTVEILEGLTREDYIAFPDPELCHPGAATTRNVPAEEAAPEGEVG